jgi:hypothetical protein
MNPRIPEKLRFYNHLLRGCDCYVSHRQMGVRLEFCVRAANFAELAVVFFGVVCVQ